MRSDLAVYLVVARIFETDPNTVLGWLVEAADHLEAFSRYFLHDLHVEQVQMDQYQLCGEVKSRLSPTCLGDRAPGQHLMQTRNGLASAVGAVPGLP
jgi:hypothetical protein